MREKKWLDGLWQLHKQEIKETEQEGYGNG